MSGLGMSSKRSNMAVIFAFRLSAKLMSVT
jgi:hypothetical protein